MSSMALVGRTTCDGWGDKFRLHASKNLLIIKGPRTEETALKGSELPVHAGTQGRSRWLLGRNLESCFFKLWSQEQQCPYHLEACQK